MFCKDIKPNSRLNFPRKNKMVAFLREIRGFTLKLSLINVTTLLSLKKRKKKHFVDDIKRLTESTLRNTREQNDFRNDILKSNFTGISLKRHYRKFARWQPTRVTKLLPLIVKHGKLSHWTEKVEACRLKLSADRKLSNSKVVQLFTAPSIFTKYSTERNFNNKVPNTKI